jgi:AraC family transcriptional regulator of adaptative response / DNA-3-methyladenine glycosylase II
MSPYRLVTAAIGARLYAFSPGRAAAIRCPKTASRERARVHNPPMVLDAESCYRALAAHDARFDGRFFVGVRSTRIYCRPVCTVRLPRRENCRFFRSAAAAEVDGFRPCMRCRPELAPGLASIDASAHFARAAAAMIEDGALQGGTVESVAARIGVTSRHLRRIFATEFGVSPIEYAQTQRLLLAKRLLTDTSLPVLDVALASGFGSLRRFNALIRARYRMPPSRLRKDAAPASLPPLMRFELAYRPPYDWQAMLDFLGARAVAGIEHVSAAAYCRTLAVDRGGIRSAGWIEVSKSPRRHALCLAVSASLARAVPAVLARVRHAFDVTCDPEPIAARLGALAQASPGLRVPGTCDGFELAVRAVIGQQISVPAARTMLGRLVAAVGTRAEQPMPNALAGWFPDARAIAACSVAELGEIGVTTARAQTLRALAHAVIEGDVRFDAGTDVERTRAALERIPGIGPWTSGYIAMRALGWPDAFLDSDLVVRRAMGETRAAAARARSEAWRPWRSYAVIHLWRNG